MAKDMSRIPVRTRSMFIPLGCCNAGQFFGFTITRFAITRWFQVSVVE